MVPASARDIDSSIVIIFGSEMFVVYFWFMYFHLTTTSAGAKRSAGCIGCAFYIFIPRFSKSVLERTFIPSIYLMTYM